MHQALLAAARIESLVDQLQEQEQQLKDRDSKVLEATNATERVEVQIARLSLDCHAEEQKAKEKDRQLLEAKDTAEKAESLIAELRDAEQQQLQDLGQDNADATVAAAVAAGITEFDTAPLYDRGCAEERLGKAVAKLPQGAAKIITKTGRMIYEPDGETPCIGSFTAPGASKPNERIVKNDFTADGAEASLSQSLSRMGLQSVYGLRIHDPNELRSAQDPNDVQNHDGSVDEVSVALAEDGMLAGLRKLRAEGKIQHVSLGMNTNREAHMGVPDEVLRLMHGADEGTFDSAQLAGGWNLLCQEGLPCLLECQRRGIAAHVAGVFASGMLVGVDRYAYKPAAPQEMREKAERWRALAAKYGCSLPAVAMAFAALPAVVSRVVVGMSTPEQVKQNLETLAESNKVPVAIWKDAQEAGLFNVELSLPV